MASIRKKLSVVAFGGNWSEELLVDRQLESALETIDQAALECASRDVEDDALTASLKHIGHRIKRGPELGRAFRRAVRTDNMGTRQMEARRIATMIRTSAGK